MRWNRFIAIIVFLFVVVTGSFWVFLETSDVNRFKPQIAGFVKNAIGRELKLADDIDFHFGFHPSLVTTNASLANASWGSKPEMISVKRLEVQVRFFPLFLGNIKIKHILFDGVDLLVETDKSGAVNWDLITPENSSKKEESTSFFDLRFEGIEIKNLDFTFQNGKDGSKIQFSVARLDGSKHGTNDIQILKLEGLYNNKPVSLSGDIGLIWFLISNKRFPINLSGQFAEMEVDIKGAIDDIFDFKGLDFQLTFKGDEIADTVDCFGLKLPETGAFDGRCHLTGSGQSISLTEISTKIASGEIKGSGTIDMKNRCGIKMQLSSSMVDLTPMIQSSEKKSNQAAEPEETEKRLFSAKPLPFDLLEKVDADIDLKIGKIHLRDAVFESGHLKFTLKNKALDVKTFEAIYDKQKLAGSLQIQPGSPPPLVLKFLVQEFNLGRLLKELKMNDTVQAKVDVAIDVKSKGESFADLMANLNGSVGAVMGEGYLSKYLDLISRNLSQIVTKFWSYDEKDAGHISCAVIQFDIKDGLATSAAFVFNTEIAILKGEGTTNLKTEEVDFLLLPTSKSISVIELSTNLKVSGTLMEPTVRPEMFGLTSKSVRFLSTLAVGPVGLLAPFVSLGAKTEHPCDIESIDQ
jgi:uncharacterized protein involved in outer membrane biogenesis